MDPEASPPADNFAQAPRRQLSYEAFKREIFNLPNMITIGRVFLIPPVLWLIDPTDPWRCFFASVLFTGASALDKLDGYLARRQGLVTVFGKFVDPLADKIMVMAVLVYLIQVGSVAPWLVALLLGREFYISGLRLVASADGVVIAASGGGAAKTVLQVMGIAFVLVHYRYRLWGTDWIIDYKLTGHWLLYVSLVLSLWSAWEYTVAFRRSLQQRGSAG